MVYLDTSVVVAYYCPEKFSDIIEIYLRTLDNPVISNLTDLEFSSAISRKIRNKELSISDGEKILTQFRLHREEKYYHALLINSNHYQVAKKWIEQFKTPLRNPDALHLAAASSCCRILATTDKLLAKAALQFGIKTKYIGAA